MQKTEEYIRKGNFQIKKGERKKERKKGIGR